MTDNISGTVKNLKANIAIIGGGGAGLAAAVAAAENGASNIIVLEKRGALGGNTNFSGGPFGAESPVQKRAGIIARRDDLFEIAMNWAHWQINPRIVRAFIDKSGDTIRWLEEKGLEFECIPLFPGQYPLTWHVAKGYGAKIMKVLASDCRRLGVELLTHTPAKKLLTGEKGNAIGVLAEKEGRELKITARSVIIATGGYGGNKELLKKYCTYYHDNMRRDGLPHTGDGLAMATEIGAAAEGLGKLLMAGPHVPTSARVNIGSPSGTIRVPLMAIAVEPNTLWVNKRGERFTNETGGYNVHERANAVVRQPDNVCYTLLDNKMVQTMTEQGLITGTTRFNLEEATRMPGLERELQLQADKGRVKISDSWNGIAAWMGAAPKVLKVTIEEYNTACDNGYDPIFTKERVYLMPLRTAPYYAIRCSSGFLDTIGGIKINEHMQVLDKQDNPIPRLYAAGVATGGWESDTYCAVLSGHASGFAFNSGRIAGENAVKFEFNL